MAFQAPKRPRSPSPQVAQARSSLGAGFREVPEPLFIFDGLDFDGDRIINLKEQPYYCDLQLGGVGPAQMGD